MSLFDSLRRNTSLPGPHSDDINPRHEKVDCYIPDPEIEKLKELENQADEICRALEVDFHSIEARIQDENSVPITVLELVARRKREEAIRVYRELTNCNLTEANEAISRMETPHSIYVCHCLQLKLDAIVAKVREQR